MIREGIELGSLKGLAQNKTSGWFIMLLFLCPFRVLLLASFLFGIFCANWIQATTQDCPKHNDLESRRNAISVLDFPPQARNPICFVVEFREVFQLFPVRGDTPEVPGRVDWFLMGPRNVIRTGRKKEINFVARHGSQESGDTPEIAGFWCWVLQGSFKWDPFFGDQTWRLNLWSFQWIFLKDGALFGLLFENDPCNVLPPLPAYPPHQKEQ